MQPASLSAAISIEPAWLRLWILTLIVVNLAALFFVVGRKDGRWGVRFESIAIVASFVAAGAFMSWLFDQVGYMRLLGLAHLVFWGPAWIWVLTRYRSGSSGGIFRRYLQSYLVIAGISLVIDTVDVVRYLLGDGKILAG